MIVKQPSSNFSRRRIENYVQQFFPQKYKWQRIRAYRRYMQRVVMRFV